MRKLRRSFLLWSHFKLPQSHLATMEHWSNLEMIAHYGIGEKIFENRCNFPSSNVCFRKVCTSRTTSIPLCIICILKKYVLCVYYIYSAKETVKVNSVTMKWIKYTGIYQLVAFLMGENLKDVRMGENLKNVRMCY